MRLYIADSFVTTKNKILQPVNTSGNNRTTEYYSAIKKRTNTHNALEKSQIYYAKWKQPDSKWLQTTIPFIWHFGKDKTTGPEHRPVVARVWRWRSSWLQRGTGNLCSVCFEAQLLGAYTHTSRWRGLTVTVERYNIEVVFYKVLI